MMLSQNLKPGRLTLLLGPPGSGKSTLLKAIGGKLGNTSLQAREPLLRADCTVGRPCALPLLGKLSRCITRMSPCAMQTIRAASAERYPLHLLGQWQHYVQRVPL